MENIIKKFGELYNFIFGLFQSSSIRQIVPTFCVKILIVIIGFITTIIITRKLGPAGFGLYAIAGIIAMMGVKFTNFGLNTPNIYLVSRTRSLTSKIFNNSIIFSFVITLITAIILLLFYKLFPTLISLNKLLLFFVILWIFFNLLYSLFSNILIGINDINGFNFIELIMKVAFLVLLIVLIKFLTVELAFALLLITFVLGSFLCIYRLKNRVSLKLFDFSLKLFKVSIKYGFRIHITTLLAFLILRLDTLMINYFTDAVQTGFYALSSRIFDILTLLPAAVILVLFPKMFSLKEMDKRISLMKKFTLGLILFYIPSLTLFAIIAKPLIILFFGKEFLPSLLPMLLLLPAVFFLGLINPLALFLHSLGYPILAVWAWFVALIVNVTLNLILIKSFGIIGAALSATFSNALLYFLLLLVVKHEIKRLSNKVSSFEKDISSIQEGL